MWFALYRVQGEGTRVSDRNDQEGTGTLSDQFLHLPPSVGSSHPGGASGREQSDLERHVCIWNAAQIPVFHGLARKGSDYLLFCQARGSFIGITSSGLTGGPQLVCGVWEGGRAGPRGERRFRGGAGGAGCGRARSVGRWDLEQRARLRRRDSRG